MHACKCVYMHMVSMCGLAVYVGNGCMDFAYHSLCALDIPKTIKLWAC